MKRQVTFPAEAKACSRRWAKKIKRYADAIYQGDLNWYQLSEIFANLLAHAEECEHCNQASAEARFEALEMRVNRFRSCPLSGEDLLKEVFALHNSMGWPEG